jgi:membrane-bound lytic murein transglycosylase A
LLGRPPGQPADPAPQLALTRAQIEAGALAGKAPVLVWVDDAVDAHILQIQGSGRVTLEDGSVLRLGFAGSNGLPFVALGKILKDRGKITVSTMPVVRAWLKAHPAEAPALMAENPRYVFFRLMPPSTDGPVGALGVPLTPGRSLAVDPHFVPLGAPLWLDSLDPDGVKLQRLVVAQDSGNAITGAVRGDLFWGAGERAFDKAGRMNSRGGYYLLRPRQRSAPLA